VVIAVPANNLRGLPDSDCFPRLSEINKAYLSLSCIGNLRNNAVDPVSPDVFKGKFG